MLRRAGLLSIVIVIQACTMGWDEFAATSVSGNDPTDGSSPNDAAHPNDGRDGDLTTTTEGGSDGMSEAGIDADPITNCDEPDLIGRWKFDGNAKDCTSHALHGTVVGAATYAAGHADQAISLDGATYVSLGNTLPTRIIGAFTIAAWVNPTVLPSSTSAYVVGKTSALGTAGWRLGIDPVNATSIYVSRGDNQEFFTTGCNCGKTAQWFHIAGVFLPGSTGFVRLYINGALKNESVVAPPPVLIDSSSELRIGARGDALAGTFFNGLIDDMRLYGRAMTEAEVANIASQ